jgi:ATP-dependent Zn protease
MKRLNQYILQFQILVLLICSVNLIAEQPYGLSQILAGLTAKIAEHKNQTQVTIENLKKERDYYKQIIENDIFIVCQASSISTNFNDIFGHALAKLYLQDILRYWNYIFYNPVKSSYSRIQILSSAYGNGKDLLAKAMIKASGQNFIHVQSLQSRMNIDNIQQLFFIARKQGNCILFIEDFDMFITNRLYDENGKAGEAFNYFMSELTKLNENKEPIIFLTTTTRQTFVTSKLPCKFRIQSIHSPSPKERYEFLRHCLLDMQPGDDILQTLVTQTKNFNYALLARLCILSQIDAYEEGLSFVKKHHLENQCNKIKTASDTSIRSNDRLYQISIHEATHATIAAHFNLTTTKKATILPTGGSAGSCWWEKTDNTSAEYLQAMIYTTLAGEIGAQEFQLPKENSFMYENGLENFLSRNECTGDILQAREFARKLLLLQNKETYLDENQEIDENKLTLKINETIAISYHQVRAIIHEKKYIIKQLASELLEREILYKDQIYNIIHRTIN